MTSLRPVLFLLLAVGAGLCDSAAAAAPQVDEVVLMRDVTTLSSSPFAGRATGTKGSRLAQAYITARLAQIGIAPFGEHYAMPFSFTHVNDKGGRTRFSSAVNLVGHIKGTVRPERIMVVSAHYDHLGARKGVAYPGADDNASGVAAMLAIASHFKAHPPENTIVFAAFDAEELGLQGAAALLKAPPFPVGQVRLNLNLDMVGRNDNNEIYAAGTRHTPSLKPLVLQGAAGSKVKLRLGHDGPSAASGSADDWTGESDHGKFFAAGIPFIYFGVEDHADYHKPSDTADKINPAFFGEVTRMLVRVAAHLDQNLDQVR